MTSINDEIFGKFVETLQTTIDLKNKINTSEENQLDMLTEVVDNYLRYFLDLEIKETKRIRGSQPSSQIIFSSKISEDKLISVIEKSLMELGIRFKRHKSPGSLDFFTIRNNTVPGLLQGRGNCLITLQSRFRDKGPVIKMECLRENQVVKVLDGKMETLTIIFWNGRSMSKSSFHLEDSSCIDNAEPDDSGLFNFELTSKNGQRNIRLKADFSLTLNGGFILERITSLDRG